MLKLTKGKISMGLDIMREIRNWPSIFLNYFKIIHNKFLIFCFRNGLTIKVRNIENKRDSSGIGMVWEVFIRRNYNPKGFEINEKDTVIDIGANIGIFSLYASKKAKFGKIYSYEPFDVHYKRFKDNIKINNANNILGFNLAICGENCKRDLFISEQSSGMHSLIINKDSKTKVSIDCITLKDVFEQNNIKRCDFLKIDCEGSEYEILYTSPKSVLSKIKKISLEFDTIDKEKKNGPELKKFLEKNGFDVAIRGEKNKQGIIHAKNKFLR